MNCADAYSRAPHKRFQTCHANGVIDAGIAEKGYLWTETSLNSVDSSLSLYSKFMPDFVSSAF